MLYVSRSTLQHVCEQMQLASSIRAAGSGETAKLPLDGNAYHWSLQWQRNEALRAEVSLCLVCEQCAACWCRDAEISSSIRAARAEAAARRQQCLL